MVTYKLIFIFLLTIFYNSVFAACESRCGLYVNYHDELELDKQTLIYMFFGIIRTLPDGTKITIILTTDKITQINFFISELNIAPNIVYAIANNNTQGVFYNKIVTPNDAVHVLTHVHGAMSIINGNIYVVNSDTIKKIKIKK